MDLASTNRSATREAVAFLGGWSLLFLLCVIAYWPGLKGPFMLDDIEAIGALGSFGGVTDWSTFRAFVFGGTAGPTGRPLALLSFLIDGNNWPADAWPFKRTNLVIHLFNGALLGVLATRILHLLEFEKQAARRIALVSVACWLLHPFLVSTTLYAVQRMAQLSTLFIFAGLAGFLYGRSLIQANAIKAYLVMSVSIGLGTLLAMLSKENGILLPILVGVIEITVISSQRHRLVALNRYWSFVFIVLPALIIATYLGARVFRSDFFDVVPPRDFSMYERVLTQPRILVDYLRHWFIPELYTTGVFQDHFIKSTGLLSPLTTALSALFHIAAISLAVINRRKWPLLAFAVLFFYASHALESSVLNLELYFEHRNYLAAAFLFLPFIAALRARVSRHLFLAIAIGVSLLLAGFTRYSATVWESFPGIVEASARKAPTSARAQAQYAIQLFNAEQPEEALRVIDRAIENIADDHPLLLLNRLVILCNMNLLTAEEFERNAEVLSGQVYDVRSIRLFSTVIAAVEQQRCPGITTKALRPMFAGMLQVPQNADPMSKSYSHIKYFIGLVDSHMGEPARAVSAFEASLRAEPGTEEAMRMAADLASAGHLEEALYFSDLALDQFSADSGKILKQTRITEKDIRAFQAAVRADLEQPPGADTSRPAP
ncbi:MAG: glycosyltransferase family 39 protein [Gammaproteobacteria bacterium]|nr:glycosyltransferase family 39 protein [Gammaproteobacteria bacterium]